MLKEWRNSTLPVDNSGFVFPLGFSEQGGGSRPCGRFRHACHIWSGHPRAYGGIFKHCKIFRNSDYSDSNNYAEHSSSIQLYFRCKRGAILE
ncbi:hypothetical protein A8H35_17825 [Burkholderia thailandensis]|nr:hypothetical protein A8H35_17825 [Burkholderia thailandensis]AWY68944.1 hypothetical protein A8H36_29440 [Burkholderia thailandensis]PHH38318.1 hypothetical protein CRX59_18175 [Burkholderia thailandensis]